MENTVTRYIVEGRPKSWSPFRRGHIWQPNANRYKKIWIDNDRRIFITPKGGFVLRHGNGARGLLGKEEKDRAVKTFQRRGWDLTITEKKIQKYPHLTGDTDCDATLLKKLNSVAADLGVTININSGLRTDAEQAALYADYLAGRGPLAAKPGTSNHNRGTAADCSINGRSILDHKGARDSMERHGLCCPVPGERWHVEVGTRWAV